MGPAVWYGCLDDRVGCWTWSTACERKDNNLDLLPSDI
jgi:hypothetical protein